MATDNAQSTRLSVVTRDPFDAYKVALLYIYASSVSLFTLTVICRRCCCVLYVVGVGNFTHCCVVLTSTHRSHDPHTLSWRAAIDGMTSCMVHSISC